MSDVLTFDTAENKDDLSFWYEYKPFINADDYADEETWWVWIGR